MIKIASNHLQCMRHYPFQLVSERCGEQPTERAVLVFIMESCQSFKDLLSIARVPWENECCASDAITLKFIFLSKRLRGSWRPSDKISPLSFRLISPNDIAKKHRLSLVLVGLRNRRWPMTNSHLPWEPMTRWLREKKDRRVPTTTDVFLLYHLGYLVQSFKIGLKSPIL